MDKKLIKMMAKSRAEEFHVEVESERFGGGVEGDFYLSIGHTKNFSTSIKLNLSEAKKVIKSLSEYVEKGEGN